jgi:hypothetical protein
MHEIPLPFNSRRGGIPPEWQEGRAAAQFSTITRDIFVRPARVLDGPDDNATFSPR